MVISRVVILLIAATKVSTVVAVVTLALDALNGVASSARTGELAVAAVEPDYQGQQYLSPDSAARIAFYSRHF